MPAVGRRLAVAWSAKLGGAVYGQPLVIGNTVVAATETDYVYGMRRTTGQVMWHVKVGTPVPLNQQPCGDLDPLGITSTPIYDPATKLVYVVAQSGRTSHLLVAIRVADGHIAFSRNVPSPDHQPGFDQQRGALALTHGHIYVSFGGHFGDCGPYVGSLVAMPASDHGPIWTYKVPTAREGGIWNAGGPVVSATGKTIFVAAGNGAATHPPFDGADSVIALTPQLRRTGLFAPSNWAADNAGDLDLGSMSPALVGQDRILQVGKDGIGYLLNAKDLGGVGGQIAQAHVCPAFGGSAVSGTMVYVPCVTGLAAVSTAGNQIVVRWRGPAEAGGSPVIGGGAVWVASWTSGALYALSPGTGKVLQQISLGGPLPHFVSPSLSGNLVLIGTMTGVTAVSGA